MKMFAHCGVLALLSLRATSASGATAFAAASGAQPGLAVGSDARGVLRAKLCPSAACDVAGGLELGVPQEFAAAQARSRLAVVGIGLGRRAVVVSVPSANAGRSFQVLVIAALGGSAPKILFSGVTGLREGADGVRQGNSLTISEPDAQGVRRIVVGFEREDLDLCGRPAVLAPQVLDARDLALHPAKVQRLSSAEREQAPRLEALPATGEGRAAVGLLRALGASSAVGSPQALTDGKSETSWAENRGGAGRGEFVVMSAPPALPITGFELIVQPPTGVPDPGSTPRELWLVTRSQVFEVRLPESARASPGARFRVTLPRPVQTDCVALVTESAFVERPNSVVAVAELAATTEFENQDPKALVGAMAGGGERAQAAGAVLRGLGEPGFLALAAGFEALDEGGRRVALDMLDAAPCALSVPSYVNALASSAEVQRAHARDRLRRCAGESAEPLALRFASASGPVALQLATELSLVAPARAVEVVVRRLAQVSNADRRALRVVLARAALAPQAAPSVRRLLTDAGLSSLARVDLLRALGGRSSEFLPDSAQALAELSRDGRFSTRFLSLGPAAALAANDANARALLVRAFENREEPWLRWRALELAPRAPLFTPAYVAALEDGNVRVREAAARALGEGKLSPGAAGLRERLADEDEWPLVRRAAARALGALPREGLGDAALGEALEAESAWVRAAAAESLGTRGVRSSAGRLREIVDDREERFDVRVPAASALGALCDGQSADLLTRYAQRLSDPLALAEERALGEAALGALGDIAPADLQRRIAPLSKGRAEKAVERALARASSSPCRAGGKPQRPAGSVGGRKVPAR